MLRKQSYKHTTTENNNIMHTTSLKRMQWFKDQYIKDVTGLHVLDVGSMNVNGTYKYIFQGQYYTGMDMDKGDNVDIVLEYPYDWSSIPTDSYDVVISGQAFEHTEFFWVTIAEMTRVLKKDGLMCIIAPQGFKEHRYPVDCYRFFSDGMVAMARYVGLTVLHAHTNCSPKDDNWYSRDTADSMLVAQKPYEGTTQYVDLSTYTCVPPNQVKNRGDLIPGKK